MSVLSHDAIVWIEMMRPKEVLLIQFRIVDSLVFVELWRERTVRLFQWASYCEA